MILCIYFTYTYICIYIYILIIYICVCLCTNQITFFVWSFYIRLIRLALAFSEAFFASSAKSGAPSARDRKTLPGRSDRFAPSRSEKVAWTFVKKLSCCHVVRGCRHKAPKRPRAWIRIDVLQIYWSLEQEHLKEKWEQTNQTGETSNYVLSSQAAGTKHHRMLAPLHMRRNLSINFLRSSCWKKKRTNHTSAL